MDNYLEKIDEIVKRTKVSYKEAREALEYADGSVIDAIIYIENTQKNYECTECKLKKKGEDILHEIKKIIEKGNVSKLTVKKNGEIILNIPITASAIGVVFAPFLSLAGVTTALLTECTIEILKDNGEIIYINKEVDKGIKNAKQKFNDIKNSFK